MEKEIKIGKYILQKERDNLYIITFENTDQLNVFYEEVRNKAFRTNFGGNEYNNNSYIQIDKGNYILTVNAPKTDFGDSNWSKYSSETKKIAQIDINNK